jgi:MoaA/NifB/PqqE/SkfB family radical SAM enzyme
MEKDLIISKRLPLHVGKKCNIRCKFCFYLREIHSENCTIEEIVGNLKKYRKAGAESIDITGGEPTIHKDIVKIVETASAMGFKETTMITNGIALKNEHLLDDLVNAGVSRFVISLHGSTAEIHDNLTGRSENFNDIQKSLLNLKNKGIYFSFNYVINRKNFQDLPDFAHYVCRNAKKGCTVCFMVFSPYYDAKENYNELTIRYTEIVPFLNRALTIMKAGGNIAFWKYLPLCADTEFIGQTNSLSTFFLSPYDWNISLQTKIDHGYGAFFYALSKYFAAFNAVQLKKTPHSILKHMAVSKVTIESVFTKLEKCKSCRFCYICDGISRPYLQLFGEKEFTPIPGEKVLNPLELHGKVNGMNMFDIIINFTFSFISKFNHAIIIFLFRKQIENKYSYQDKKG